MGKRSSGVFPRRAQDAYFTPLAPVRFLIPHLRGVKTFVEPCAGKGDLVEHLESFDLECLFQSDIIPHKFSSPSIDVLSDDWQYGYQHPDTIITNPPWTRRILQPMILKFQQVAPTWLLFDADWAFTSQALPYLDQCSNIVAVGRVSWMGNGIAGKDNCAWYRFDKQHEGGPTLYGREVAKEQSNGE